MNAKTNYEDLLKKVGIPLTSIGLKEVALSRVDALRAIAMLAGGAMCILGGDVYFRRGDRIDPAYANWYIVQNPSESTKSYIDRSISNAIEYIEGFPKREGEHPIFVLVVREEDAQKS
jgi:hypothetical protein